MENFEVAKLYESIALYFMSLTVDLNEERTFMAVKLGEEVHLKVKADSGEILLTVVGEDYNELGEQLVLACLHKLSFDQLGFLHQRPMQDVSILHSV